MFSLGAARYYLYRGPTDMRKGFDGLCGLVNGCLGQDPVSGDVFIFLNKGRNRLKPLRWEPGGFVLFSSGSKGALSNCRNLKIRPCHRDLITVNWQ
jgi:transposase